MTTAAQVEDDARYADTPRGWAKRWHDEFAAAKKALEPWHQRGKKVFDRFLLRNAASDEPVTTVDTETRWPLFSANIQTQRAMLYGQVPRVTVSRQFSDAADDEARVASVIMERLLNADIARRDDTYAEALAYALDDFLLPGLGNVRVRYVVEMQTVEVAAIQDEQTGAVLAEGYSEERKVSEDVETDYVHWRDQLWSPSRVFHEVRWWAFREPMSRAQLRKRFGAIAESVPMATRKKDADADEEQKETPWDRADVWEVWSKEERKVFWFVEGMDVILEVKDDPLGLEGFWPFPRPMVANLTNDAFVPTPDLRFSQDLHDEIDAVSTRINRLQRAIKAVGVYNPASPEVAHLFDDKRPDPRVDAAAGWEAFAQSGGVSSQMQFLPLDSFVNALSVLRDYRRELIDALYQVEGQADIMRGQASTPNVTATEQRIKAKSTSVRVRAKQDEFARFASDVQKLKAEVIEKHFDPQTILERCNCKYTADAQLAPQAVAAIKSGAVRYRIEVKPEAVSMADFAEIRQERGEVLANLATFFQASAPIAQGMPGSMPFLLQILQWSVSGLRGASTIESVFDSAIQAATQMQQQAAAQPEAAQPDPKLATIAAKAQADMARDQQKHQQRLEEIQVEVQADAMREQTQRTENVKEAGQKALISNALRPQSNPFNGRGGPGWVP